MVSGAYLRKQQSCGQCSHSSKEIKVFFVFAYLSLLLNQIIFLVEGGLVTVSAAILVRKVKFSLYLLIFPCY